MWPSTSQGSSGGGGSGATQKCTSCGSTRTKIVDGLMYCLNCGDQIHAFQELDLEEEGLSVKISQKIGLGKKRTVKEISDDASISKEGSRKKNRIYRTKLDNISEFIPQTRPTDIPRTIDNYHSIYETVHISLRAAGVRLAAFTKMLAKCTAVMKMEMDFPEELPPTALHVFQHYLRHCGAAYCDDEMTEKLGKMFKVTIENKNFEFESQQMQKEAAKQKREKSKKKLRESTDMWGHLLNTNVSNNLEMIEDEEESGREEDELRDGPSTSKAKKPKSFLAIETGITESVYKLATEIPLSLDFLAAFLYAACQLVGCQWVMLSDLLRWIRENRFGLTRIELTMCLPHLEKNNLLYATNVQISINMPLYEYYRTLSAVWQSLNLTNQSLSLDIDQLTCRFMYNLNLPVEMGQRVLALLQLAPLSTAIDNENFKRQGDIINGFDVGKFASIGVKHRQETFQRFFKSSGSYEDQTETDIFLTLETKLMAVILMALKLTYRFDGKTEFTMKGVNSTRSSFDVIEWIYQLRMRMMIWEGHSPKEVLQQTDPVLPMRGSRSLPDHIWFADCDRSMVLKELNRERGFLGAIPSTINFDLTFKMPNLFPESVAYRKVERNSDTAIYMPLRHQTTVVREYLRKAANEEKKLIQDGARAVFERNYENHSMNYEPIREDSMDDVHEFRTSVNVCDEMQRTERKTWQRLFPASRVYIRHPRPRYLINGVLKRPSIYFWKKYQHENKGKDYVPGKLHLYSALGTSTALLESARPTFSPLFAELLQRFAKILGDSEHTLYTAFTMLELQLIDNERFKQLGDDLVKRNPVDITVYINNICYDKSLKDVDTIPSDQEREINLVLQTIEPIDEPKQLGMVKVAATKEILQEQSITADIYSSSEEEREIEEEGNDEVADTRDVRNSENPETSEDRQNSEGQEGDSEVNDESNSTDASSSLSSSSESEEDSDLSDCYFPNKKEKTRHKSAFRKRRSRRLNPDSVEEEKEEASVVNTFRKLKFDDRSWITRKNHFYEFDKIWHFLTMKYW